MTKVFILHILQSRFSSTFRSTKWRRFTNPCQSFHKVVPILLSTFSSSYFFFSRLDFQAIARTSFSISAWVVVYLTQPQHILIDIEHLITFSAQTVFSLLIISSPTHSSGLDSLDRTPSFFLLGPVGSDNQVQPSELQEVEAYILLVEQCMHNYWGVNWFCGSN